MTMNRRTAIAATAAAPIALTTVHAAQGADPAVAALEAWKSTDAAATAAENRYEDETPGASVAIPAYRKDCAPRACSEKSVEKIIEQHFNNFVFDRAKWIDPTPKRAEGTAYAKANPYTKPDAEALKEQLRANVEKDAELFERYRVGELRDAERTAYRALIETPAISLAGIAAKARGELLYCRCTEAPDGTIVNLETETEEALHSIMLSAERLARA